MNWGKGKQFAVRDANFQSYNAEKKYSGMYLAEFSQGPESTGAPLTTTVTFTADGRTMTTVPAPKRNDNNGAPAEPPTDDGQAPALPPTGQSPD